MSADIYYRIISSTNKSIETSKPSQTMNALLNAFGNFPIKLTHDSNDIFILRGMAAVDPNNDAWEQIIKLLESNDIELINMREG